MRIDILLASNELSQWERRFLHNILYHETLTEKQLAVVRRIERKVSVSNKGCALLS